MTLTNPKIIFENGKSFAIDAPKFHHHFCEPINSNCPICAGYVEALSKAPRWEIKNKEEARIASQESTGYNGPGVYQQQQPENGKLYYLPVGFRIELKTEIYPLSQLDIDGPISSHKETLAVLIPEKEVNKECSKCRTTNFKECHSMQCPMREPLVKEMKEEEVKEESKKETFERKLQKHFITHLRSLPDKKFLVSGRYSWTTHELALQIEQESQDGLEVLNRMLQLTLDLIIRGKENLEVKEPSFGDHIKKVPAINSLANQMFGHKEEVKNRTCSNGCDWPDCIGRNIEGCIEGCIEKRCEGTRKPK